MPERATPLTPQGPFFDAFGARLADIQALADQLRAALGEIARSWERGRCAASALAVAQVFVGVDRAAGDLARLADLLGNVVDPAALVDAKPSRGPGLEIDP